MTDLDDFLQAGDLICAVRKPNTSQPACDASGQPIAITVYGIDSKEFLMARNAVVNKTREIASRGRVPTQQEDEESDLNFICAVTKGWSPDPLTVADGKLEFNAKNARTLFVKYPGLRTQISGFIKLQLAKRAEDGRPENFSLASEE